MNKNAKISLKTNDNTIKYDILLTIKNNKINYFEKNSDTNVFLSLDEKILIRDNKDIYLEYNFSKNQGVVFIKELQNNININLITNKFNVENDKVEIEYQIDDDRYNYLIEMEW